jgi:multimeric flavodoxin WrbA
MVRMPTLLIVHHTPSPSMQAMLEAVLSGARDEAIDGVTVEVRPALAATALDVLDADGYLLGTPANIGYMSGALKHFFDTVYYPILEATVGRPYTLYVHGGSDTTGAIRGVETIATGLRWKRLREPLSIVGEVDAAGREACWELGATCAASLMHV